MYLQKVISRKNCVKNLFFAGILKVNDVNSRIRIQDPDLNPDPDPLVRSMDPVPDPPQNVMDPEHWQRLLIIYRGPGLLAVM
jgi:hypothetical protein